MVQRVHRAVVNVTKESAKERLVTNLPAQAERRITMATSIPNAAGVPGISGPPNWLGGPGVDLHLDDVRWRGAIKRAFGSGATGGDFFRATQTKESGQDFIYLTFRAGFAQSLDEAHDVVWIGLSSGATAMVIRLTVHPLGTDAKGPPSANPVANVSSIEVKQLQMGLWQPAASPTWINTTARYWLQSATDDPLDPNSRWAVQIKIRAEDVGGGLFDNNGPNIGTSFQMWYVMRGSVGGMSTILAEYRIDGGATTPLNLNSAIYPQPGGIWDTFNLTSGPANTGGVALYSSDVLVSNNVYGEGTTIDNGQQNTFIARPRNYSGANILAQNINGTFRIANWGSVSGDPNQINFSDSEWAYVPGNSEIAPVQANLDIGAIVAPNPPPATNPIALVVPNMTLPAGKSKHQCVLATLSGTNINFLNDAVYRNMNYDSASLNVREAEISIRGVKPFSPEPRDVYLALEKVNMLKNTPPGTNEGRFLEASFERVIRKGGPLGEKLRKARNVLSEAGDLSGARLEGLLQSLSTSLRQMSEGGLEQLAALNDALHQWLLGVGSNETAAKRLAKVCDKLANWIEGSAQDSETLLSAFSNELSIWLSGIANDPATLQNGPKAISALSLYHANAFGGSDFSRALDGLADWLQSNRPSTELPKVVNELRSSMARFANASEKVKAPIASFVRDVARWLGGSARLETLVQVLTDAGLTEEELDQLFPTFRIHVYHDTGFREPGKDGTPQPVLRTQSSFGLYMYHEGSLQGWETAIQGAQRIEDNLYLLAVPNEGTAKIKVVVQAVDEGEERIPEDPIRPRPKQDLGGKGGCLPALWRLFGFKK
jgi:hypothetical protein